MISLSDIKKNGSFESRRRHERGSALILVLIVLSIFSLLGLFIMLEATIGLRISDNYESRIRATCAAMSGLNHARALMRGLGNDVLLKGPDGVFDSSPSYLDLSRRYDFRNPVSIASALALNIIDPLADMSEIPDDGTINTGFYSGTEGIPLIPLTGIAQKSLKLDDTEEIVTSRYLLKVTDNNGETAEIAGDPGDNSFVDGDGTVIVRSMGIASTIPDFTGSVRRRNSVVVLEGRYSKFSVFDFGPALLVVGSRIFPSFDGFYDIDGGPFPGIGVIDSDTGDMLFPEQIISAGPFAGGNISGAGLPSPSILDMTVLAEADRERAPILNAEYLHDFIFKEAPKFCDAYFNESQFWTSGTAPDIGSYDSAKPFNAPGQKPKFTVVHGDLHMTGNLSGGGLLIVTGDFECRDTCQYDGLILVIGSGRTTVDTIGKGITGGLVIANLSNGTGIPAFGIPEFAIRGDSRIAADEETVKIALSLIPPVQTGFREISGTDP